MVVYFLDWFSGTIEVAINRFRTFRSIVPSTCDTQCNVSCPSFHPLLFAVCGELESFTKSKVKEGVSICVAGLVLFAI